MVIEDEMCSFGCSRSFLWHWSAQLLRERLALRSAASCVRPAILRLSLASWKPNYRMLRGSHVLPSAVLRVVITNRLWVQNLEA